MKFDAPLVDLLSITSGVPLSPASRIWQLAQALVGHRLSKDQLNGAAANCKQHIYRLHPWMREVSPDMSSPEALDKWLNDLYSTYGVRVPVVSMDADIGPEIVNINVLVVAP